MKSESTKERTTTKLASGTADRRNLSLAQGTVIASENQMKEKQPPQAIVFKEAVMLSPERPGEMSRIVPAGEPSPYTSLDQVPENLRSLVGQPSDELPPNNEMQYFVPREQLAAERIEFERLNTDEDLSQDLRDELAARDREHLALAASRNKTLEEAENRNDEAVRRVAKELEEEARAFAPPRSAVRKML
jgi:hypothetical protein